MGSQSIGDAWSVRLAQEVAPDEVDLAPVWAAAFVEGGQARQQFFASGRGAPASGPGVPPSEVAGADFLCLTGQARLTLGAEEADVLRRVLEGGGVVLGEGCAAGPEGDAGAREFVRAFAEAASQLGRQLARGERNDTLLTARFVFSGPPAGSQANTMVIEREGMIYSDADCGCAWQGGSAERPLPRGPIRDATEFGVSLACYRQVAGPTRPA